MQERIEALTERLETSSTVGEDKPVRDRPEDATDFGSKTKRGKTSFFRPSHPAGQGAEGWTNNINNLEVSLSLASQIHPGWWHSGVVVQRAVSSCSACKFGLPGFAGYDKTVCSGMLMLDPGSGW